MDVGDLLGAGCAVCGRVNDEDVGDLLLDRGSQLLPASGGNERMLRSQNYCQVL